MGFEDLEEVVEVGSWDYDWSCVAVFLNDRNEWLVGDDSGCSCNGPWDGHKMEDFTPYPFHEWRRAIKDANLRVGQMYLFSEEPDFLEKSKLRVIESVRTKAVGRE